ncbi:MAG: hypothetical protein F4Y02_02345 [Chloroflexi bacterium]|nr:hypothetical protein [Chloroflexota bacterium]
MGCKTVELRRRFPVSDPGGAIAYIYSTSPVSAIVGCVEIQKVVRLSLSGIWRKYNQRAFIEKEEFDRYFAGLEEGLVLEFVNVRPLPRAVHLKELRERFGFRPPQSFVYTKPNLRRMLQREYSAVLD